MTPKDPDCYLQTAENAIENMDHAATRTLSSIQVAAFRCGE
jgi:hypothetical protein